jgi:hypothetical protein
VIRGISLLNPILAEYGKQNEAGEGDGPDSPGVLGDLLEEGCEDEEENLSCCGFSGEPEIKLFKFRGINEGCP